VSQLKKSKLRLLAEIYFTFLKLGSVSFGGGYAMISLIEREIVNEKKMGGKRKNH
jgi:chromate transporter